MDNVFIVYACDDWDWSVDKTVLSVHASKEAAEKAKADYNRDHGGDHDWAIWEEWKVKK